MNNNRARFLYGLRVQINWNTKVILYPTAAPGMVVMIVSDNDLVYVA